jgi:hypothetical protein
MHVREHNLRQLARERIDAGELPRERHGSMRGMAGHGEPCALCGAAIQFEEVERELAGDIARRVLRFHRACHAMWMAESE